MNADYQGLRQLDPACSDEHAPPVIRTHCHTCGGHYDATEDAIPDACPHCGEDDDGASWQEEVMPCD